MSPTAERLALAAAIVIGAVVRIYPVLAAGSVVGDGGLIHAMVEDLRGSGFLLPVTTSYNDLGIPFAYPPGALLVAAIAGELVAAATLELLRWLPLVASLLTLTAFAWLARATLPRDAALGAVLAFALMPSAYSWLVAGGGLTRAAGLLLAIVAAAVLTHRRQVPVGMDAAAAAGAVVGLTALTHPQAAIFAVIACAVLSYGGALRTWLARMAVLGAAALIVTAPWLVWVAATHGVGVLLGPGSRVEPLVGLIRMLNFRFSEAPFMDLVGLAGIVGLLVLLAGGSFRLPTLLLVTSVVGAGGGGFLAAVPWALLAGVGIATLVRGAGQALRTTLRPRAARPVGIGLAAVALFLALIGSLGSMSDRSSKLHPLAPDVVAAMRWASAELPAGIAVIVPTDEVWGFDDIGEWLPALAERQAIGTVQGSEWLGADGFRARLRTHAAIVACAGATASCYRAIDPEAALFVPKGRLNGMFSRPDCCPALRETLESTGYRVVFDGPGATIAVP